MSIIKSDYELSVWRDQYISNQIKEKKICVIGSSEMNTQSRAIDINLTRNVNGQKKLSFKMYRQYIDSITGENVYNIFCDYLINEAKVKLKYRNKWYDFYIKNISENSQTHECSYELEDALVQELSKNGFNITLDQELMNNLGDVKQLASTVMAETDWTVESEAFVQTVSESLIYLNIPKGTKAKRIFDQKMDDNNEYSEGITIDDYTFSDSKKILAFYSSCKNRPHRFQFIYCSSFDKNSDGSFKIGRKDDRTINEKDCQYYIDFLNPDTDYQDAENTDDALAKNLGLALPTGFSVCSTPAIRLGENGMAIETDSYLSSWYRGARYGFAQQTIYVPVLERYCQKFERLEKLKLDKAVSIYNYDTHHDRQECSKYGSLTFSTDKTEANLDTSWKDYQWSGLKIALDYNLQDTYIVEYELEVLDGMLETLGGHKTSFNVNYQVIDPKGERFTTNTDKINFSYDSEGIRGTFKVHAEYKKIEANDPTPYIFIQPNRGSELYIKFKINKLKVTQRGEYYGYTDSEFISPSLVLNCINNYNFESTGGWTATASTKYTSSEKSSVENVNGRFPNPGNAPFKSVLDDFYEGNFNDTIGYYKNYLKMSFYNTSQFVLNSGLKDNRTTIKNISAGEEWILDYSILDEKGSKVNINDFDFNIGEYIYDPQTGGYIEVEGNITFSKTSSEVYADQYRIFFKVDNSNYTKETFPKNSKLFLKIIPKKLASTNLPDVFYIESMALFKKHLDKNGDIIVPDYEKEESMSAKDFVDTGVVEKTYRYFSPWQVSPDNPEAIANKDDLVTIDSKTLTYKDYQPVYNKGATKVRTVSIKESNYFNILQTIAETFEAWLELYVVRDEMSGEINQKIIRFKNYIGKNNYANFRYGVNLKQITRQCDSKNIATKLIVKQNSNEQAEDGFCTIARAGTNPTGENFIYDFQYYHNQGLMDVREYLNTVSYLEGAKGLDAELWTGNYVTNSSDFTLNGYEPRIRKINDALQPINTELAGLKIELINKEAEFTVAESLKEASNSTIEQTREEFFALTGIYPEESLNGTVTGISWPKDENGVAQESLAITEANDWWTVGTKNSTGAIIPGGLSKEGVDTVKIPIVLQGYEEKTSPDIEPSGLESFEEISNGYKASKEDNYSGIVLRDEWEKDRKYTLSYKIQIVENSDGTVSELLNIGSHSKNCLSGFSMTAEWNGQTIASSSDKIDVSNWVKGSEWASSSKTIKVTISGIINNLSATSLGLWIQPNRGENRIITFKVFDIETTKTIKPEEAVKNYDRKASCYLNVLASVSGREIPRTYKISVTVPAGVSYIEHIQKIKPVDVDRSDVQKYTQQYLTAKSNYERGILDCGIIEPEINSLKEAIRGLEVQQKRFIQWKKILNQKFYSKYNRFILEGTWISEEYIDDNKYYADAQSVLYNSCYPQVAYNIGVLFLSRLPGYELFDFDLGDKTYVIDDEFFGKDTKQEVVITELVESLDDPSKDSIKVQTFKNQFQGLFSKITATTQQVQYNTGSYEKGEAFVDASNEKKGSFLINAINNAKDYLEYGQTVVTGKDGITITEASDRQRQLRMVGGAILFSTLDEKTKETVWRTGLTNEGISASLITAGCLNTGAVQIMSGDDPVFRWDSYGISAYDALWSENGTPIISGVDSTKFVRFDKHGIYGINSDKKIDGSVWHPTNKQGETAQQEIDKLATFALTWEGLKVQNKNNVILKIGDNSKADASDTSIMKITSGDTPVFEINENGEVRLNIGKDNLTGSAIEALNNSISAKVENKQTGKAFNWKMETDQMVWYTNNDSDPLMRLNQNGLYVKGEIHATSGKIGSMTIDEVTSPSSGQNLITYLDSDNANFSGYNISSSSSDYVQSPSVLKWKLTKTNNGSGSKIGSSTFIVDKIYTLSYTFKRVSGGNLVKIGGHSSAFEQISLFIDGAKVDSTYGSGHPMSNDTEEHTVIFTGKYKGDKTDNNLYIQVNRAETGNTEICYELWDVMLVEGPYKINWGYSSIDQAYMTSQAQESADQAQETADSAIPKEEDNTYSWSFSPTSGIRMWNKSLDKTDANAIFKVNNNGLYIKGNGEFTGKISASSGDIDGWTIGTIAKNSHWEIGDNTDGFAYTNTIHSTSQDGNDFFMFFLRAAGANQHCFAVRKKTGAQSVDGKGIVTSLFSVSRKGDVVCSNIEAQGGKIGAWDLKKYSIKTENSININDIALHIDVNGAAYQYANAVGDLYLLPTHVVYQGTIGGSAKLTRSTTWFTIASLDDTLVSLRDRITALENKHKT